MTTAATARDGIDIDFSKGGPAGKLEWKGALANPFDEEPKITAFSAAFHLPLEAMKPLAE